MILSVIPVGGSFELFHFHIHILYFLQETLEGPNVIILDRAIVNQVQKQKEKKDRISSFHSQRISSLDYRKTVNLYYFINFR